MFRNDGTGSWFVLEVVDVDGGLLMESIQYTDNEKEVIEFACADPSKCCVGVGFGILDVVKGDEKYRMHYKDLLVKEDDGSLTVKQTHWVGKNYYYPDESYSRHVTR